MHTPCPSSLQVIAARDDMQWGDQGPPPLLLKIAPDLTPQDMADIAQVGGEGWDGGKREDGTTKGRH